MSTQQLDANRIKEFLYSEYKNSKNISSEISNRYKKMEYLTNQINILKEQMELCSVEIATLQDIKESQKIYRVIEGKISKEYERLTNKNLLNRWNISSSTKTDKFFVQRENIKNLLYSAFILYNHVPSQKLYRVDYRLEFSPVLVSLYKEFKNPCSNINDIILDKDGRVFFNEKDALDYIEELKNTLESFLNENNSVVYSTFKDTSNVIYKGEEFIIYDGLSLENFNIKEGMLHFEKQDEIAI